MKRVLSLAAIVVMLTGASIAPGADDAKASREALQALNGYIGSWTGDAKAETRKDTWTEKMDWSWRFKGDEAWLVLQVKDGKQLKGGELRFLADKKLFQLAGVDLKDQKVNFEGPLDKGYLTLDRVDPGTKETQRLKMNLAGGGVRFVYVWSRKPEDRTNFSREFQVAFTKDGESLGAAAKKNECIVSGGLGTMTVSHNGKTYYVCCSGCRDAFNENPEKYIKEFEEKKKKK